jgi:integrase/recombinase XerD
MILVVTGKNTDALFLSLGSGDKFHNLMDKLLKQLKKQNSRIKDIKQLRASVITNWLKVHNIRKVQHLSGHRFVSSTEAYQANNMDDLKEDVNKYHPDF